MEKRDPDKIQAIIDSTKDEIHIWDGDRRALTVTFEEAQGLADDLLWLVLIEASCWRDFGRCVRRCGPDVQL